MHVPLRENTPKIFLINVAHKQIKRWDLEWKQWQKTSRALKTACILNEDPKAHLPCDVTVFLIVQIRCNYNFKTNSPWPHKKVSNLHHIVNVKGHKSVRSVRPCCECAESAINYISPSNRPLQFASENCTMGFFIQ